MDSNRYRWRQSWDEKTAYWRTGGADGVRIICSST